MSLRRDAAAKARLVIVNGLGVDMGSAAPPEIAYPTVVSSLDYWEDLPGEFTCVPIDTAFLRDRLSGRVLTFPLPDGTELRWELDDEALASLSGVDHAFYFDHVRREIWRVPRVKLERGSFEGEVRLGRADSAASGED